MDLLEIFRTARAFTLAQKAKKTKNQVIKGQHMGSGFSRKKKEAKLMQQQFSQIQEQMSTLEITGTAGAGLVTITLTGEGEMKAIKIKPDCVDKEDIEGLEILIKAAHADAQNKLKEKSPQGLSGLSGLFG